MSNCDKPNTSYIPAHQVGIVILRYALVLNLKTWNSPNRVAPFWRFYWSFSPGAYLLTAGKRFDFNPALPLLVPPYCRFSSRSDGPLDQFYIHFSMEHFAVLPDRPVTLRTFDAFDRDQIRQRFVPGRAASTPVWQNYLICKAVLELENRSEELREEVRSRLDPRIEAALKLMNERKKLTNSEIARQISMSRDNFIRLFRREIGISPWNYRNSRRMELAQTLLMDKTLSIDEIALQCGFADRYQFSKQFTAHFNTPPGRYRRLGPGAA